MNRDYSESEEPAYLGGALARANQTTDARMTVRGRIKMQRVEMEKQIERLKELEKLLDENPAIERFQDLMSKSHL